jgi:hypothetical protein
VYVHVKNWRMCVSRYVLNFSCELVQWRWRRDVKRLIILRRRERPLHRRRSNFDDLPVEVVSKCIRYKVSNKVGFRAGDLLSSNLCLVPPWTHCYADNECLALRI